MSLGGGALGWEPALARPARPPPTSAPRLWGQSTPKGSGWSSRGQQGLVLFSVAAFCLPPDGHCGDVNVVFRFLWLALFLSVPC